jgi:hypothetical protein
LDRCDAYTLGLIVARISLLVVSRLDVASLSDKGPCCFEQRVHPMNSEPQQYGLVVGTKNAAQ